MEGDRLDEDYCFSVQIGMDRAGRWREQRAQVAGRGLVKKEKGAGLAKAMETLREVSVDAGAERNLSPCPCRGRVLVQLQEGSWPRECRRRWQSQHLCSLPCTCLLGFYTSIFIVCPCFWLQTFRSPGQMAAVNIQIGCTASVQGARTGLAAAARALRPSAQHMCAGAEAPSRLLGWEMEPGRPLEQVEM